MTINRPKINPNLKPGILPQSYERAIQQDIDLFYYKFNENYLSNITFEKIEFNSCTFTNCKFQSCRMNHIFFSDIIFKNCDFSNTYFSTCNFTRVSFQNCKLVGTTFDNTSLFHTNFKDCNLKYGNFTYSCCRAMEAIDSFFVSCSFKESSLAPVNFQKCDFSCALFYSTSLSNVDFSTCFLDGITVSLKDLKGIIVSSYQAVNLSKLFGIQVKDTE